MNQVLDKTLWEDLEKEVDEVKKKKTLSNITATGTKPRNDLFREIVSKVNISDLASEFGVDECPNCGYGITFDDTSGCFICNRRKYDGAVCDCAGGILNFTERFG